jgi:hypothetical protein
VVSSPSGHWLSSARMHVIETQTSAKTAGITRSSTEAPLKGRDGSQRDAAFGQPSNLPADRRSARKFRRNSRRWDRWSERFQARHLIHLSRQKSAKISLQAVVDRCLPVCDRPSPRTRHCFCAVAVPGFEPGATFPSAKSTPRCHYPVRVRRPGSHSRTICRALRVVHDEFV